jgi:cell division protein FtsN
MKLVGVLSTAVLSLTLGAAAPSYARQEQHDQQEEQKDKPAQQDNKKAQPDKSAKQDEKGAQQQEKDTKQDEKGAQKQDQNTKQDEKSAQQQDKDTKQGEKNAKQQDKNTKQDEKSAQQQQHTQQARPEQNAQRDGGNGGGRIPDDRFKANFGQQHTFRVSQADYTNHSFQYGGYSFGFVGAWPSNWLYTQNVFVVDIDGVYYLCNPMYPGVNVVLSLAL